MAHKSKKLKYKLEQLESLRIIVPVILAFGLIAAAFYSSPTAGYKQTAPQKTGSLVTSPAKKSSSPHNIVAPRKTKPTNPSAAPPTPAPTNVVSISPPEPVVTPAPSSRVSSLRPSTPSSGSGSSSGQSSSPAPPTTTTSYTSTNWSGYFASTGSYSGISATWTAPVTTGNSRTFSADATWIGIGGVTSSDLIQIGTENTVSPGGQVSTAAFYELLPASAQILSTINVTAGDVITASLIQVSAGQWTISLSDTSSGQSYDTVVTYTSSGSTAEWIEEDPSFTNGHLVPLDNFSTVSFSGGLTTTSGSSLSIAGSGAQPITMVDRSGQAIVTPSTVSGGGFSVTKNN